MMEDLRLYSFFLLECDNHSVPCKRSFSNTLERAAFQVMEAVFLRAHDHMSSSISSTRPTQPSAFGLEVPRAFMERPQFHFHGCVELFRSGGSFRRVSAKARVSRLDEWRISFDDDSDEDIHGCGQW